MNIKIFFKRIKEYYIELDESYGANTKNKKDIKIGFAVMLIMAAFSLTMTSFSEGIDKFYSAYIFVLSISVLIMMLTFVIYDSPKNLQHMKRKTALKIIIMFSLSSFYIITSPVLVLLYLGNIIIYLLGIEIYIRNIHIALLNTTFYILGLLICMFSERIKSFGFFTYIFIVITLYLIFAFIRNYVDKKSKYKSYQEKYNYLFKSRKLFLYIINILTMLSGVAGLYINKYTTDSLKFFIYIIMPAIIFSCMDQILNLKYQNMDEKKKFITCLYEELVVLKDIAIPQIKDFSGIKIRIKLSINPWEIENYKNYFIANKTIKPNDKFVINTLDSCRSMLLKEYNVFDDNEKEVFYQDLHNNIENLAKCLTD